MSTTIVDIRDIVDIRRFEVLILFLINIVCDIHVDMFDIEEHHPSDDIRSNNDHEHDTKSRESLETKNLMFFFSST